MLGEADSVEILRCALGLGGVVRETHDDVGARLGVEPGPPPLSQTPFGVSFVTRKTALYTGYIHGSSE